MTEEKLNALRQTDINLRNALTKDEAGRPLMPADLNERLMQRMAAMEKKKPHRIVWPWIAAACVAGILMVWLMPPRESNLATKTAPKPPMTEQVVNDKTEASKNVDIETVTSQHVTAQTETKKTGMRTATEKCDVTPTAQDTSAKRNTIAETPIADVTQRELAVAETTVSHGKTMMLTERNIPVTRPENLRHTPEEVAKLKKQAAEAYLKWVELELEVSKYNLEQASLK